MASFGQVILLNGVPRSGKSSIAAAIQREFPGLWINLGVDTMMAATPSRHRPGIGLRPGGERPELEPIVRQLYAALFDSIAAHSRLGIDVVSDLDIHDGYSRPLGIWPDAMGRLAGLPVLTVGVLCPLETIMARRNGEPRGGYYESGDVAPHAVHRWQAEVHKGKAYDLEVDTSVLSPVQCAEAIRRRLDGHFR